jgi:hypothetical protein
VRALFDAPPAWTQQVLATAWGGTIADQVRDFAEPASPDGVDARLAAYTAMGAWGVYLLARATMTDTRQAQRLALAWRGDQLRVYAWGEADTTAVWQIQLAGAEEAFLLSRAVTGRPGLQSLVDDRLVTLVTSTAPPPEGLLAN